MDAELKDYLDRLAAGIAHQFEAQTQQFSALLAEFEARLGRLDALEPG